MSDFHRPTLTYPNEAYSATQVRLYGIPGNSGVFFPNNPHPVGSRSGIDVSVTASAGSAAQDTAANQKVKAEFAKVERQYHDDPLELANHLPFPFPIPAGYSAQLELDMKIGRLVISTAVLFSEMQRKQKNITSGIIVSYSFEGHCYDLPKPKIMLIPSEPQDIPPDDCGYDKKNSTTPKIDRYRLWIVDKLDECVEFEMNQGFIEQLVLDANLPGKRSPAGYASRFMMGHRSGRLND
ncbi:hypothetical protein [Mesorhizobium helmanticense]|uniref:Uncharacterized protein n=1 Tax=Mesorhizobium helmanticense TaxID=1776423 RepID=A0A2T4J2Y7_9HYPH|nr:hypothetical protein [Mesorhizobium helmanticense]PTE12270.1 hypothetical protein C9427_01385 [Mesorhizobium helmanticense]